MASRSTITIRGWVATNPVSRVTTSGRHVTSFRIADAVRRRDPETGAWSDSKTTWYTVQVWGDQARNAAESLRRSEPVIVTGHPWLEEWRREDGETSTRLVIDADAIGPDLAFGTTRFARTMHSGSVSADGAAPAGAWQRDGADTGSVAGGASVTADGDGAEVVDLPALDVDPAGTGQSTTADGETLEDDAADASMKTALTA